MSRRDAEERLAQLQARGDAQRLAAALAVHEARQQLAPLRSAAGVIGLAVRALSPGGGIGGVVSSLARFLIGHPAIGSALVAATLRLARRPVALALAGAAGLAAWWLLRPAAQIEARESRP